MSGADALKRIRETSFDLVLTDLRLDDVDGLTIISEICRVQPDTVAIILTGYASMESAIKALREGAYDYLVKPCDVDELRAVVARGIERRQLGLQLKERLAELETANQTIRELNRDLQRRIEAATAQLQQRMQELASALEQPRFLSMASHELKTPLTSISGLAQVLLRRMRRRLEMGRPDDDDWQEEQSGHVGRLELLNSQTARLGRLVDELLDVSRIESGKLEFRLQPVDMAQLLSEVASRMQLSTNQHTIEVELNGVAESPVPADRDHLEQVLDNLVSNAIKFSPDGGTILLRVRDQGIRGWASPRISSTPSLGCSTRLKTPSHAARAGWAWACISARRSSRGTVAVSGPRASQAQAARSISRSRGQSRPTPRRPSPLSVPSRASVAPPPPAHAANAYISHPPLVTAGPRSGRARGDRPGR